MKMIHVTVALYVKESADINKVMAEMDYDFEYGNEIISMELIDYKDKFE